MYVCYVLAQKRVLTESLDIPDVPGLDTFKGEIVSLSVAPKCMSIDFISTASLIILAC